MGSSEEGWVELPPGDARDLSTLEFSSGEKVKEKESERKGKV